MTGFTSSFFYYEDADDHAGNSTVAFLPCVTGVYTHCVKGNCLLFPPVPRMRAQTDHAGRQRLRNPAGSV